MTGLTRCSSFDQVVHADGHQPFVERNLWNIDVATLGSLGFDVGRPDHLAPLLGFVRDELAEVGGRAYKRCAS
jgi:hypothetical protein